MAPLALFLAVAAHAIFVGKDIVLSLWSEDEDPESGYRLLYAFLCLLVAGAHWVRFRLFFRMTLSASRVLHASLFAGVAGAPLSFFERTPVGDITARFAGDTDAVDTQLPTMLSGLLDGILSMLSGLLHSASRLHSVSPLPVPCAAAPRPPSLSLSLSLSLCVCVTRSAHPPPPPS